MTFADRSYNLRIELDTKNCELSAAQIDKIERCLSPLRQLVDKFPVSDLYITISYHPRNHQYRVKTALVLTKRTLVTGDLDPQMYPAFERCISKLVMRVEDYQSSLGAKPERDKVREGTYHEVVPTQVPDAESIERAVENGDYRAFREATYVYEEPIRKRIGRWISRYPELDDQQDGQIKIEDLVEEVFLNAFERYGSQPEELRFGEWLESLIDPSIKLILAHPDEELDNISFARSAREAPPLEG